MPVQAKIRDVESNLKEFGISEKYGKFTPKLNVPCELSDSHNYVVKVMWLNGKRTNLSRTDMVLERLIHSPVNHLARLRT